MTTKPRCGAPTATGDACQAYPKQGTPRCVRHQDVPPEVDPTATGQDEASTCGAPTKRGGLCANPPLEGFEHCHVHKEDLDATEEQKRARREANLRHGYFVSGFLKQAEEALYWRVVEEGWNIGSFKRHVLAALTVRADRMMRWEAEGQQVSGFTTEVFTELRKTLEAIEPDELEVQHSWDTDEVARQVEQVLEEDPGLLVRLLPPSVQGTVREALEEAG